jgi:hypothetical protein
MKFFQNLNVSSENIPNNEFHDNIIQKLKHLKRALGKVPVINIKMKSLVKGNSNNAIPYLIISFETESMVADLYYSKAKAFKTFTKCK